MGSPELGGMKERVCVRLCMCESESGQHTEEVHARLVGQEVTLLDVLYLGNDTINTHIHTHTHAQVVCELN